MYGLNYRLPFFCYMFVFCKFFRLTLKLLVPVTNVSRSRSPVRRARSPVREDRSESPRYRSPEPKSSPQPSRTRRHSPSPDDDGSPQRRDDASPDNGATQQDGSDYSDGGRERSGSDASPARDGEDREYASPKTNGHSRSPSPRDDRSPIDDEDDNQPRSPRGSESPWMCFSLLWKTCPGILFTWFMKCDFSWTFVTIVLFRYWRTVMYANGYVCEFRDSCWLHNIFGLLSVRLLAYII